MIEIRPAKEELRNIVKNNDVLMYKDGAKIGRISFFDYDYPHKKCAINEHVFILRSKLPSPVAFVETV